MYRFKIEGDEWILRFSPQLLIEDREKKEIVKSLLHISKDLSSYSHGDSFMMFVNNKEAIVFQVERIPSLILTVSHIIPEENWYKPNFVKNRIR